MKALLTKLIYPNTWRRTGTASQSQQDQLKETFLSIRPKNCMTPCVPDSPLVTLNSNGRAWNLYVSRDWMLRELELRELCWLQPNSIHRHMLINVYKAGCSAQRFHSASPTTWRGHVISSHYIIFMLLGIILAIYPFCSGTLNYVHWLSTSSSNFLCFLKSWNIAPFSS